MAGPLLLDPEDNSNPNNPNSSSYVSNSPLFPLNKDELLRVAKILIKSGLPTSVSFVCGFASGLVCLRFAGKYGTPAELAGATLGFTWSTVFCVGILSSINQGFSILAAQLFGAKKYNELGLLFQRNAFVLVLTTVPLLLSLLFADVILLSLGLQEDVSIYTGIYLKCAIPSVLGLAYFECIKYYLIAQNCFHLQPITQGSLSIVHIFWCYLFVVVFDMPVAGVALAKSVTDVSTAVMLWICYKYSKYSKTITIQWDKSCMEKWWPHLKQTLVLGANLYVEWIALEISLFIVGMLNDEYSLGAQGIAVTIMNVFFMLPLGNSVSMQAYIGNSAGEGSKNKCQKYMFIGISMNIVMTLANTLIIIIWSKEIAEFFTNNEQTRDILQTMLSIYSISHIADTTVSHFSGVLRSVGSEFDVLVSFLICYVGIGVNCEWIFGIALGFGYPAVWYSMGFGMYLMAAWAIRKVVNLDWDTELLKIRERTEESSYIEMAEK